MTTRRNPLERRQLLTPVMASESGVVVADLAYDYSQIDEANRDAVRDAALDIKERTGRVKLHLDRARDGMLEIGRRLAGVKALLPHGQFSDWCAIELDVSQRSAQRMMQAAEVFGDKSAPSGHPVSLLSDSVLYLLSGPTVPEAARTTVIDQVASTGKAPTKREVQATLAQYKPLKLDRPKTPTRYSIPDELAAAGYVVEDHPAGGYGAILIHAYGKVNLPITRTMEEAIAQIRAHMAPTPPLRTLTVDETIAVIWRVVKYALPHPPNAEPLAKWSAYRAYIVRNDRITHYSHAISDGVQLEDNTLNRARTQIMTELNHNIEHHQRSQVRAQRAPEAHQLIQPAQRIDDGVVFAPEPAPDLAGLIAIYEAAWQNIPACSELLDGRVSHTIRLQLGSLLEKLRALESETNNGYSERK